jgi:hypothetical protein
MFQHRVNAESYPVAQSCINTLQATLITLITDGNYFGNLRDKNKQTKDIPHKHFILHCQYNENFEEVINKKGQQIVVFCTLKYLRKRNTFLKEFSFMKNAYL